MTAKEYIIKFEDTIKNSIILNITKYKQKNNENWNLIYDIDGLVVGDLYVPFCRFVFNFNIDMTELTDEYVLFNDGRNTKTIDINNIDIAKITNTAFIQNFSDFVMGCPSEVNKISKNTVISFTQTTLEQIGISVIDRYVLFDIETADNVFSIKIRVDGKKIILDNKEIDINSFDDIYKIISKKLITNNGRNRY